MYIILEIKTEMREVNINLLFHLFMHLLDDPCMCPDWELNPKTLAIRTMLYQLSYPARDRNIHCCVAPFPPLR